jgi:hypothetical protein
MGIFDEGVFRLFFDEMIFENGGDPPFIEVKDRLKK